MKNCLVIGWVLANDRETSAKIVKRAEDEAKTREFQWMGRERVNRRSGVNGEYCGASKGSWVLQVTNSRVNKRTRKSECRSGRTAGASQVISSVQRQAHAYAFTRANMQVRTGANEIKQWEARSRKNNLLIVTTLWDGAGGRGVKKRAVETKSYDKVFSLRMRFEVTEKKHGLWRSEWEE